MWTSPLFAQVLAAMAVGLVAAVVDWYLRTKAGYTQGYILPSFEPFTTLGVAVSLFLGFRTNSCYARCVGVHPPCGPPAPRALLPILRPIGSISLLTINSTGLESPPPPPPPRQV